MSVFPAGIVTALHAACTTGMSDHTLLMRPLRGSDPDPSVGLYADSWVPNEESRQIGQEEPVLARYTVKVQNLCVSVDEVEARERFTINAKIVRVILARDQTLHASLRGLSEDLLGTREVVKRFGIARQTFLSGALSRKWTFLGTTDFWVETEAIRL